MSVIIASALPVLADQDALSPPMPEASPHLSLPKAPPPKTPTKVKVHKSPPKKTKAKKIPTVITTPTPISTATPTPTATATPVFTATPDKSLKVPAPTPTPKPVQHGAVKGQLPQVTTIPNPVWGDKVIFRVMSSSTAKAHIVIYDRFFNKVDELEGEGDQLFDILWSLQKIPQGIYYYQSQIDDTQAGTSKTLPMQNFAVMKDEAPNE
ncbi:MAG TPA: hypothetical protein VK859_12030 [bacterium]|nr:hypothetical protein [bacterium]